VRRVAVIVLALVVVPAIATTATSYRCMYDGETRSACCCPTQPHHDKAPVEGQALRAACCCKLTQVTTTARAAGTTPSSELPQLAAPVVVAVEAVFPPAPAPIEALVRPQVQRGPPCSLLARHCSLLL
jgi:hypothetical protein